MLTDRFSYPKGAHNAAMTWMVSRIELAVKRDEVHLSPGASTAIYDSIRNLRMLMARLPDMYDGRMNIAYIHFVNMLVSTLVLVRAIILFDDICECLTFQSDLSPLPRCHSSFLRWLCFQLTSGGLSQLLAFSPCFMLGF